MDVIDDLIQHGGASAWRVINEIRWINGSDGVLANLAAGPLEDFLVIHGEGYISEIEDVAKDDLQFRRLPGATWQSRINELWARIRSSSTASW